MENEKNEELTPEEKARRVEEFFAKKQRQTRGEEAVPGADQMGSVAGAAVTGAVEGAATGALKGAAKAVKAGVGGLIVDPLIGAAKLAGTPVRMLGWDGIHRLADAAEKGWNEWGADALDHGYEDWGTKLGDAGAKITGIAGMLGSMMGPGALAKVPGLVGKAAAAYNAALPFIFGNSAAVDTYDRAKASGQSEGRALAEAATDGAINFLGFKMFANKSLNRMLKIPEMQGPAAERLTKEGIGNGVKGFESLVKAVRNGSVSEILVNRAKGAAKAGGIMGAQNFLSSVVKQYADEDVRPVEEMSDEELQAAKGQIDAWEAEQAKAAAEGREPDTDLKPEWEKDFGDRLAVAFKAGLHGVGEGALMEGVMGGGELALTLKEAREQTAAAVRRLIATPKGRAFMAAQNADAMGIVEGVAREGGTLTKAQLDAAGLPPDMPMREVRRLAFELKRDGEMAARRAEMETEEYRKRAELAERLAGELEEGKELEFETEEQKAEAERALQERKERIGEARADEMVASGQGMADTLFGEDAGVLVRRGTAEERRAAAEGAVGKGADARTLKDAEGQVCGYWDRGRNEVVLFGNADAKTVAHELGWHATRQWAERNSPGLLAKMNAYAQSCPPELRAEIEAAYPDFARNPDALLDEIGAGRFERELGARFGEMLERSPEAKSWWQGLKDAIAEAWRGMVRTITPGRAGETGREIDLKALEAMTPEEGMAWLADRMIEGKALRGAEGGETDASRGGAEARSVKTVEVKDTGDGTLRFQIVRNGQKKTYKRPEEALRDFIAELDGVEMDAEQQGIYDVATGGRKTTDIRKDDLGNLIKLHRTGRNKGAQKIINVHYAGKRGKVTAKEVIDMGLVIREGALTFDGTPEHPASRRYEMLAEDGARLRVVVDLDKKGNEAVINFYSDRDDGNPGHKASSGVHDNLATSSEELYPSRDTGNPQHNAHSGNPDETGANYSTGGERTQGGDIRPSIRGIYTGTAADYANRSREDGKDDGPSLKKIGTGEGSQVYGWGLYGSNVRGVAEGYAESNRRKLNIEREPNEIFIDGKKQPWTRTPEGAAAQAFDEAEGDRAKAIATLSENIERRKGWLSSGKIRGERLIETYRRNIANDKGAIKLLEDGTRKFTRKVNSAIPKNNLYEQTFFTDRAPGDESHLLKWYEPVSEEQLGWIESALKKEGLDVNDFRRYMEVHEHDGEITGQSAYQAIGKIFESSTGYSGRDKAASEFLARAGIDGVKYPVDSYGGKGVKDGDKAGWNYVSFRDDNIRVDHKWTDGQIRYSRRVAAVEDGEVEKSLDAIIAGKVKRSGGKAIRLKEQKGEEGKVRQEAQKVFRALKDERIPLPNGGELYFAPDERTVAAYGGSVPDAWAEYCIHLVTHGVTKAETGERYRTFSEGNVEKVLPEIRETVAANQVKIAESRNRVLFYRQTVDGPSNNKSRYQKIVADIDENGDARIDLRYITGMHKSGRIPGQLTTLEDALQAGYAKSDATAARSAFDGADYSTTGGEAQGGAQIRPQRRSAEEEIERTERALKAVREGRVRVAASGGAAGESSEPGAAASAELLAAQRVAPRDDRSVSNPVSLPMSGLVGLYRALRSSPSLPKVLTEAKRKGAAWVSRLTKGSDVELNPEAFGIIDETDRARIKEEMKAEGMFRDEDPVWNMKHSKQQCDNEHMMSELRLEDRLNTLADRRVKGLEPGGQRVAANALAHDIGRLVMEMPMSEGLRKAAGKEGAKALKDLKTVGEGLTKELEKEWKDVKGDLGDPSLIGSHLQDAVEAAAWWRGEIRSEAEYERIGREQGEEGLKAIEEEETRAKAALAKDRKGLAGELFGMFLAAPEELRARAPRAFNRIVEAMGANEPLANAYARIANADAPTEVMAKIEAQYTVEAMRDVRKAEADLKKPLATWWQDKLLKVAQGVWSKESPALMRIRWAAKERIALAKEALKAAKKGGDKEEIARAERDLETAKRTSRKEIEDFKHEIIAKYRDGGAGRNYMNELGSRVLGALERGGLKVKDLDRYLKCRNVIANQGKAMDFGISPQEANRALEAQRSDLGEAKWAALEEAAKEFHANRERNILEDANVREMIGERRLASWKLNSSYIRTERTLSVEEVAELNAAQFEPLSQKTVAKFRKKKETKGWELLTEPANVARMRPVELDIESASIGGSAERLENRTLRARLKEIFAGFGLCKNAETGNEVEFPGSAAGKMLSQSGADMSAIAPHLKSLFEGATAAWFESETRMEGHTYHPEVKGYRQYINRFSTKDGTEWYIRFTVRENKGANGRNDVHAATVSDVQLYKNAGATTHVNKTLRSSGEKLGSTIPANDTGRSSGAFVDRKISYFLSGVKTERAVDVVKEMDALIKMHQKKGVMGGDRFLQPLVGSFSATKAPTETTAMHDMSLLEYARQNHYVATLAETATRMGLKGFKVVRDMRYRGVNAGERYGTRAFMKDGENYLLIMPKDVERGFRSDPEAIQFLVELNRDMAKMLTSFSARFAVRNVARNREANENNIEWMAPSLIKKAMGDLGFRPEARKLEMLIERAVVRLPDWVVRNPVASLVWNPKTNMHWIGEATRLAKLLTDPGELRRVSEEADRLVKEAVEGGGDVEKAVAAAKRLLADCEKAKRIAKMPIFAGNYLKQLGYGGKDEATGLFDRLEGRRAETDADRLPYLGKVWKGVKWWMEKVQDFNTLEETRTKIAALLSAEWQRAAAAAKGKKWKFDDGRRIEDIIAVNSGSPMGELRGTWWNAMETMVTGLFGNVSMKGAVRTIESAKRSPLEWTLKAARRAENYAARRILWQGGGMLLLLQAARRWFADDEDAQKNIDVLEGWAKKMTKAFAMITDYRLKTYDITPLAILGNDAVVGVSLPRGDEDKLITPLVDYAVDKAMKSETAQAAGFIEPLGGRYDIKDLAGATIQNSGLMPDVTRGGVSFKLLEDTFYAMIFSNPYNAFTGRPTYDEGLYKNRWERKGEFLKEMLKQAWSDLGGQSVLPLPQGPEDAKDVPDGMTGVWSATGVETQVPGGKTVFQMLHTVPVASAILSGVAFINMNGQDRIEKRLLKMEAERKAILDHVAMQCLDLMARRHDDCADYMPIIQEAVEQYRLDGDDIYAIQQAIVRKKVKAAKMMGQEDIPVLEQMRRMKPGEYERRRRHLVGIGWEVE